MIERQSGILRQAVIHLARVDGWRITELKVQRVISFVHEYIEHAPALMTMIEEAATNDSTKEDVQLILDATDDYFLASDDIIPDHLGLVGLMDDAYMTHSLMQAISDRYKSESGHSLLPLESHDVNAFVRRLIGEPFAGILDEHVSATLARHDLQQNLDRVLAALAQLNLSAGPDPMWGYARASEIASSRLGAMAVI